MQSLSANEKRREWIMKHKPWLKSTGPKTKTGKDRSKMNALKTDPTLYQLMKEYKGLMTMQKELQGMISL